MVGQSETERPELAFADYVVTRQLAVDQNTVIYRARKKEAAATEKNERYVIVLFHSLPTAQASVAEADPSLQTLVQDLQLSFLEAVKQQKKAHEAGVSSIVPVYDFGIADQGAWYATDYYPRGFLKKWITQRAGVTEDELRHIVYSTAQCLVQLKKQCKRSHGNLAPANILIGGKLGTPLRDAPIILTYLPPGDEKDAAGYELADLRALGQIVFQLVTRQDLPTFNPDLYPVTPSEHWAQLGKHGEFWRELCNRLLDPELSLQRYSLSKLAAELKPGAKVPLAAVAAGIMLLVLAGGAAVYWFHTKPPVVVPNQPPVAQEQTVETLATMAKVITLAGRDPEGKPVTFQIVDNPAHGSLNGTGANWLYQPAPNFTGTDAFTFKVNDGQLDSGPAKVMIAVKSLPLPPNTPPTISSIPDQVTEANQPLPPLKFTVSDQETPATDLTVSRRSSDQALVPDANILVDGRGTNRTLTILPVANQTGKAQIWLIVSDGSLRTTNTFTVTVQRPYVPPNITGLKDQSIKLGTPIAQIPFKVGNSATILNNLFVVAVSSKPTFLPDQCLKIQGSGIDRLLVVDPVPKQVGYADVIVAVSDTDGKTPVSTTFRLEVVP